MDDPKDIPIVDVLSMLWVLGVMGVLPAAAVGLGLSGFIAVRHWKVALMTVGLGITCWVAAFMLMEWTKVAVWLLD